MNYRVRRRGEELGIFPIEELRRRREIGEFSGGEYVQREGMSDWQVLDLVLQQGYQVIPPPIPPSPASGPGPGLVWGIIGGAVVCLFLIIVGFGFFVAKVQREVATTINQSHANYGLNQANPQAVATAGEPIQWTTRSQTYADEEKRDNEFSFRQWVDGYEQRGQRNPAYDAEADQFLRDFVAAGYGGPEDRNSTSLSDASDQLAGNTNCTDPLVLTVAGEVSLNQFDAMHRFERALMLYPQSRHRAFPRLYAMVRLTRLLGAGSVRGGELQTASLEQLETCFSDGSFTTNGDDQQEIGEIFINGWGYNFFAQNAASVSRIVHDAGPNYQWLALTLDGEREIIEAWAARGGGYADSVSDEGWQGFRSHLGSARGDFTAAWKLHPDWPLAPERMIYVSLGDSGLTEMRQWFDRTTMAQIDYARAWSDLRWGLRPRWYGNEKAMLALGVAAINTGRFDTDVPRKYSDCVSDVESELGLPAGQHIYGRKDIWPNLNRMYQGYVSHDATNQDLDGWRTSYAIVAYLAGEYGVARAQLEALNWKPVPVNMEGWGVDLSLMPDEVAARTGSLGTEITKAELARGMDDIGGALKHYKKLNDVPDPGARIKTFIEARLSELTAEKRLQQGDWVSLLPARDDDPDWVYCFGKAHVLSDGALEVESGAKGHMLYPRIRTGADFEVRGEFEVVHSANKNFQGGLVMGVPDFDGYEWYGFRLKRHDEEGDVVCFAQGWSRRQIVRHVILDDVTNSFDFTLQSGKVTALVNGVKVFDQAAVPANLYVAGDSWLVGLGAFSDSPDTIIRYRNVKLRKL